MRYRSLHSNYQSCGTMRASESGIRQHSLGPDPITGKIDVFDVGLVHCRPSGQTSFSRANGGMRDYEVWKESLVNDLLFPSRLNEVHEVFVISPISVRGPVVKW